MNGSDLALLFIVVVFGALLIGTLIMALFEPRSYTASDSSNSDDDYDTDLMPKVGLDNQGDIVVGIGDSGIGIDVTDGSTVVNGIDLDGK